MTHALAPIGMPDTLLRVASTIEAGLKAGLTPIDELCVEQDPENGPVVNIETLAAYEWANHLHAGFRVNTRTGEVTFTHESAGVKWIIRYVPERRGGHTPTNWTNLIQQTTALPPVPLKKADAA